MILSQFLYQRNMRKDEFDSFDRDWKSYDFYT